MDISSKDITRVATNIKKTLTPLQITEVMVMYDETDGYDHWSTIVEDLIYNVLTN